MYSKGVLKLSIELTKALVLVKFVTFELRYCFMVRKFPFEEIKICTVIMFSAAVPF